MSSFLQWLQEHKGISEDYCRLLSTERGFDIREQYERYLDEYHDWIRAGVQTSVPPAKDE